MNKLTNSFGCVGAVQSSELGRVRGVSRLRRNCGAGLRIEKEQATILATADGCAVHDEFVFKALRRANGALAMSLAHGLTLQLHGCCRGQVNRPASMQFYTLNR
jgi:hypothetical protein